MKIEIPIFYIYYFFFIVSATHCESAKQQTTTIYFKTDDLLNQTLEFELMIKMNSANDILSEETCIKNDHVWKVYKIGYPKCALISDHEYQDCNNPHCTLDLKVSHVNLKPMYKLRHVDTFVGLKNLGATCYINSLLQLWFHNINIRNAILNWDPMDDEDEKTNHTLFNENSYEPITEIGHLQLIFAQMQFGNQATINPLLFVNSLNIDISIQEDSEEFQNYLITFCHKKFNSQSNVSVRDMVKDNFFGEYNSVTICLNCKTESVTSSQFREICLNIKCHKTVTDSLQEYFEKENMTGDDKYFCNKCNNKQDATRQIVLTSLPNLIHLKLMRYVYDNILMTTTKLNTEIRCPYTIDMGKYLDLPNESSKENNVYNLYGVLIHKGKNANVGHFITHIKDLKTEEWYEMDDENVKMLNTYNSNFLNGNIFEGLISIKSTNIQANEYKTNDAYMLVYMNASMVTKLKTESLNCELSPRLTQYVNKHNSYYADKVSYEIDNIEFEQFISNLVKEIKCNRVEEVEGDAISFLWLLSLAETKSDEEVYEINNKAILCPHNKLNPNTLYITKYIGTELADRLYDLYQGGPRLKLNSSLCDLCVRNRSALICMSKLTSEHKRFISKTQHFASKNNNLDDKNNIQTFWIGKKSLQCWQIKYMNMFKHFLKFNNVLPNETLPINQELLISFCKALIRILDDTLIHKDIIESDFETDDKDKTLFKPDNNTSECTIEDTVMKKYFENLETDCIRSMLNSNTKNKSENYNFFIEDTEEVRWTLNKDITCPHGNLCIAKEKMILVPEVVKNIFETYFPKAQYFAKTTKPCSLCKAYYKNIFNPKIINCMHALVEEKFVKTLIHNDIKPKFIEENCPYFCITKDFLLSWKTFISQPHEEPKPLMINNKLLLCQDHNELLFEPTFNFVTTDQSVSVIITKKDWLNLIDFYQADCGVFVYFDKKGIIQKSTPKVCQTCTNKPGPERSQYKDYIYTKIFIQVTGNNVKCDETDEYEVLGNSIKKFKRDTGSTNSAYEYEGAAAPSNYIYNRTSDYGTRSITMSSNDTVLLLKNKIEEVFNVPTVNQILRTALGKPLIENEAKLSDLNIYPGSVIIAKFINANLTKNVAVEGFKGSTLMN